VERLGFGKALQKVVKVWLAVQKHLKLEMTISLDLDILEGNVLQFCSMVGFL